MMSVSRSFHSPPASWPQGRGGHSRTRERKLVDANATTDAGSRPGRTWKKYYHGDFHMDDVKLHQQGVNRLGNVLVPNASYGTVLEESSRPCSGRS